MKWHESLYAHSGFKNTSPRSCGDLTAGKNSYLEQSNHLFASKSNTHYKKSFGAWGESCVDEWMNLNGWATYRKNLKMRKGEIDRVYKFERKRVDANFCVAEIKTIYCANQKKFFSLFTEVGLSALIKRHQIRNLYKYAENLNSANLQSFQSQSKKIYIRFFIVLKVYENYEKESFFQSQKNYKICLQKKDNLILSFVPEF